MILCKNFARILLYLIINNIKQNLYKNILIVMFPKISVIMPVYNAEKYVAEAIKSILNQTYDDFELIIINDASQDKSLEIIKSFDDSRIKLLNNKTNLGCTISLNKGIKIAKGEYIARMDSDDISLPERFSKQIDYLEKNPRISVVGTYLISIDENGNENKPKANISSQSIIDNFDIFLKWKLFFGNCFAHPTIMARKKVFDHLGLYQNQWKYAEDYEMWLRISLTQYSINNLPDTLLKYRCHKNNISIIHNKTQVQTANLLSQKYISQLLGKNISLSIVKMIKLTLNKEQYKFFPAFKILIKMYKKFISLFNVTPEIDEKIHQDICYKLTIIAHSDQNLKNKYGIKGKILDSTLIQEYLQYQRRCNDSKNIFQYVTTQILLIKMLIKVLNIVISQILRFLLGDATVDNLQKIINLLNTAIFKNISQKENN